MNSLKRRQIKRHIEALIKILPAKTDPKNIKRMEKYLYHALQDQFAHERLAVLPRYSSIAISGPPGAGRSTLLQNLTPHVYKLGWETFSGGEWSRKIAIELGNHGAQDPTHHTAADYGDNVDLLIDQKMQERLKDPKNHILIESWIAGWNMRVFPHVLKVLLCCDEALRIDRVVNRDGLTVAEAKEHLRMREITNFDKWERMYHARDFWNPRYYNLVIDTYKFGAQEVKNKVLKELGLR